MLTLVIGTKRTSSWSLRPWLALKSAGIPFEEVVIGLRRPDTRANILRHSPSGKVPLLKDGALLVWDSLAICEYLAERFPETHLWPDDREARAVARSVSAEMHGGFMPLRNALSMDMKLTVPPAAPPLDVAENIARIGELWSDCRRRFGKGGPFLFGAFTIADAMYAPVVSRFRSYGVTTDAVGTAYRAAVEALPAWKEWSAAAQRDVLPGEE